jgi:hypothetical protein
MSTLRVSTISDPTGANQSTPEGIANGIAKAWVNFNGTGTVEIRASFNVDNIVDNGTGDYTVEFTTALPDRDYAVAGCFGTTPGTINFQAPTTTYLQLELANTSGTLTDRSFVTVAIFR